jgi:hypothetical protein
MPNELAPLDSEAQKILDLMLQGANPIQIKEYCLATFGHPAAESMEQVFVYLLKRANQGEYTILAWSMECYRDIYQRARQVEDFSSAMKALKEIQRMAKEINEILSKAHQEEPEGAIDANIDG